MKIENQEIADHILSQKNWMGISLVELAQAGRVTPKIAGQLATNYLNEKYKEGLRWQSVNAYLEEKKNLIQILERKISEKNG